MSSRAASSSPWRARSTNVRTSSLSSMRRERYPHQRKRPDASPSSYNFFFGIAIFVTKAGTYRSAISKGAITRRKYKYMKQTLTIIAAIALGGFSFVQAQPPCGAHGGWHSNPLEEMSFTLNLTDAQKAKVQPILDQA